MEGVAKSVDDKLRRFPAVLVVVLSGPHVQIGLALEKTHVLDIVNLCPDKLPKHSFPFFFQNLIR